MCLRVVETAQQFLPFNLKAGLMWKRLVLNVDFLDVIGDPLRRIRTYMPIRCTGPTYELNSKLSLMENASNSDRRSLGSC
jgi:hypothetical protein